MQRTTNYGLCQYEGSDKTSYLVNYNDDMLKIDTAIKGASDDAAAAQTKADSADGKADVNAGNISSLNTQINGEGGIAADVVSLQGAMNTVTSLIGNGEPTTTDKTLIGAINELNGELAPMLSNAKIIELAHAIEITADSDTMSSALDKLQAAIVDYISAASANKRFSFKGLNIPSPSPVVTSAMGVQYSLLTKDSNPTLHAFGVGYSGTNVVQIVADIKASGSAIGRAMISTSDGYVWTDYSASSVTDGTKFKAFLDIYEV